MKSRECIECENPACRQPSPTKHCSRCGLISYCSASCQRQHWREHKSECIESVSPECIECDNPTCRKPALKKNCSRCHMEYYCDTDCQKQHWRDHKPECTQIEAQLVDLAWLRAPVSEIPTLSRAPDARKTCGICLVKGISKPAVLMACGHAFCFVCLSDYFQCLRLVKTVSVPSDVGTDADFDALGCPTCRFETLTELDSLIARAIAFCVRAKRMQVASKRKKMFEFCGLAKEMMDKVVAYVDGYEPHPWILGCCWGILNLEVLGEPKQAIDTFDFAISKHNERTRKAEYFEKIRDDGIAALVTDKYKKVLMESYEQNIASLGYHLTDEAFIDFKLKLGEAKECLSDWDGAMNSYAKLITSESMKHDVQRTHL